MRRNSGTDFETIFSLFLCFFQEESSVVQLWLISCFLSTLQDVYCYQSKHNVILYEIIFILKSSVSLQFNLSMMHALEFIVVDQSPSPPLVTPWHPVDLRCWIQSRCANSARLLIFLGIKWKIMKCMRCESFQFIVTAVLCAFWVCFYLHWQ